MRAASDWTFEEIVILRRVYSGGAWRRSALAAQLLPGRSKEAIRTFAHKLRLAGKVPASDAPDRRLRLYRLGKPDSEIAAIEGVDRHVVASWRRRHKLPLHRSGRLSA